MKDPQLKDGYTKIANELLEAFARIRVPGEASQVLWVILRKTYGWHKKEDWLTLSTISKMTGLPNNRASRGLNKLLKLNMILQKGNRGHRIYAIRKTYALWTPFPKKRTCLHKEISGVPIKRVTKDTLTKDKELSGKPEKDKTYNLKWEYINKRFEQIMGFKGNAKIIGMLLSWGQDIGQTVVAIGKSKDWTTEAKFIGQIRRNLKNRGLWSDDDWILIKSENTRFESWISQKHGTSIGKILRNL